MALNCTAKVVKEGNTFKEEQQTEYCESRPRCAECCMWEKDKNVVFYMELYEYFFDDCILEKDG